MKKIFSIIGLFLLKTTVRADLIPDGVSCPANFLEPGQKGKRIVGGTTIAQNSWPWLVSITSNIDTLVCHGAIIHSSWILTAAHCCTQSFDSYIVKTGVYAVSDDQGVSYKVKKHVQHENYVSFRRHHDICLMQLQDPISLNTNASIGCFGDPTQLAEDVTDDCFVAGGGHTEYLGDHPEFIKSIRVNIFSHEQCKSEGNYNHHDVQDEVEFCAGHMEGQKDACQGDSGAPLICVNNKNEPVLHGLTAWGVQCGLAGYPGVYTRVGAFLNWISETITGKPLAPAANDIKPESNDDASGDKTVIDDQSNDGPIKLPDKMFEQTLAILGQTRTVTRNENGDSSPMILANSLDKITLKLGKIQNRLGKLVTANIASNATNVEKTTSNLENVVFDATKKCINDALRTNQPKTKMLEIIAQLNEDSQKLKSGFFAVLENVDGGKICDLVEEKITLIHEYARHTLYKCNTGYSLDGDQDEPKFLKKRVDGIRSLILKKLQCSF